MRKNPKKNKHAARLREQVTRRERKLRGIRLLRQRQSGEEMATQLFPRAPVHSFGEMDL